MITLRDAVRPHAVGAPSTALLADAPLPSLERELGLLDGVAVATVSAPDVPALSGDTLLLVADMTLDVASLAATLREAPTKLCLLLGVDPALGTAWPSLLTLASQLDAQILSIVAVQGTLPCVVTLVRNGPVQPPLGYLDGSAAATSAADERRLVLRMANELVVTTLMNRVLTSQLAVAREQASASAPSHEALRAAQDESQRLARRLTSVETSSTYRAVRAIGRVRGQLPKGRR